MTVAELARLYKDVEICKDILYNDLEYMRSTGEETICLKEDQVEQITHCLLATNHVITDIFNNLVVPGTESR